jgi:hypothetical protein
MKKALKTKTKVLLIVPGLVVLLVIGSFIPESREELTTTHFTLRYSSSIEKETVAGLSASLEDSYPKISQDLKTVPTEMIEVNLYAKRWRYIQATKNWGASGNIEGTSKLHFVAHAWSEADSRKVAVHEFTHTVVLKLLIDQEPQPLNAKQFDEKFAGFPVWLWEAVSVYEANQLVDPSSLPYLANGSYPGLTELSSRSKGQKIYDVGYTIIDYILSRYGQDKFIELITSYGNVQTVLSVTEAEFSKGWYEFVKHKYLAA